MITTFEAFVAEQGLVIWRGGAKLRGQWFHGGRPCISAKPTLLGGQGCSHECEELYQETLLVAAHRGPPGIVRFPLLTDGFPRQHLNQKVIKAGVVGCRLRNSGSARPVGVVA